MNTATLLLRRSGGAAARCYASASASISTGRVAMVQGASRGALVVVFFYPFSIATIDRSTRRNLFLLPLFPTFTQDLLPTSTNAPK